MSIQSQVGVHTTISKEYWMKAKISNISWSKALKIGIDILAGNQNTKAQFILKIKEKKREIQFYEGKILELQEKSKTIDEQYNIIIENEEILKKSIEIFDNKQGGMSFLNGRIKLWNNNTGMGLNAGQYLALIKAYKEKKIKEWVLKWKK